MGKGWKTAGKVENAMKKGMLFTKLAREIQVSAKAGGPDPASNARLRAAIDAAKEASCPNDTIDRAIKKGAGLLDDGKIIEEITYEGYGPHGVGVMVECQTDNKHRTAPEIRNVFKKHGGSMGESGSVAWMFSRVGKITAKKAGEFDPEEEAIEANANEVEAPERTSEDQQDDYAFYCNVEDLETVRQSLLQRKWTITSAGLAFKANNLTELNEVQMKEVSDFLNAVDDLDDTHRVYATV